MSAYQFLSWLDNFIYIRESRTNVTAINDVDSSESEEENLGENDLSDDSVQGEESEDEGQGHCELANTSKASSLDKSITAPNNSSTPLPNTKSTPPPLKRKAKSSDKKAESEKSKMSRMGKGTKNGYMDEMELNLIRDLGKSIKNDSNEPTKLDDIDLYTRSLAADLRKLSERDYLMVKNEFQGVLFRYQMAGFGQVQNQNQGQWQGPRAGPINNTETNFMNNIDGQYVRWVNK